MHERSLHFWQFTMLEKSRINLMHWKRRPYIPCKPSTHACLCVSCTAEERREVFGRWTKKKEAFSPTEYSFMFSRWTRNENEAFQLSLSRSLSFSLARCQESQKILFANNCHTTGVSRFTFTQLDSIIFGHSKSVSGWKVLESSFILLILKVLEIW